MRPVFTRLLGQHFFASPASTVFGPVPAGEVWIVRDIVASNQFNTWLNRLAGLNVQVGGGIDIWRLSGSGVVGGQTYHYDGRQVVNPGDSITVNDPDGGWSIRITGFVFDLP